MVSIEVKGMRLNAVLIAALLVCGLASADIVPAGFAVSPATFRAGVSGTLSFTLTNTGTRTITGIDLYGNGQSLTFLTDKTSVGSLGPGASTSVTIPFRVADNAQAGVYNIQVSAYWVDVDGQGYKTFSYPLTVSSLINFQLDSLNISGQASPGQLFTVNAAIKASGGNARNVRLSSVSQSFALSGSSEIQVGDVAEGSEALATIPFIVGSSTAPGVYSVPMTVTYEDGLGSTQMAQLTVGPVTVSKGSIFFAVSTNQSEASIKPGGHLQVTVTIANVGNDDAKFVQVALAPTATGFVLLNTGQQYLASIPAGATRAVSFDVGANTGILPGFYPFTLSIGFSDVHGVVQTPITQNVGLTVAGDAAIDVIAGASPSPIIPGKKYTLSLQVSNVGTFTLKSVRVHVSGSSFDLLVSPNSYIGTLNVDDYSTVTYPVYLHDDAAAGTEPFNVTITYRDASNNEQTLQTKASIDVLSADEAAKAYASGGGTSPLTLAIGLVAVAAVAYFGYKRFLAPNKRA